MDQFTNEALEDGTIAGALPIAAEIPQADPYDAPVTFEDEPVVYGDDQIVFDDTAPNKPGLNLDKARQQAAKMHFALGDKSPGMDVLVNMYATGTADRLRNQAAQEERTLQENTRNQIIKDKAARGETITPEDVQILSGLAKYAPKVSPETVLERKYADTLINSAQVLNGGTNSPIAQGFRQNPERTAEETDIAATLITRQEIVKKAIQEVESVYQAQGWGGWLVDQAKGFVPLYGTVKLGWGEKNSNSYLRGNVVEDMVRHFWGMPLDQMPGELSKYLSNIAKDNPSLAREVAQAMLSHTSSSQFIDNAFTVIDAASLVPAGRIAKGARAASEAITGARATPVAEGAVRSAGEVISKPTQTIPPVPKDFTRYWKVEETWRGPDQKSFQFQDPQFTRQLDLPMEMPFERRLDQLPESLRGKPQETMSEMSDRLKAKWGVKEQLELDLSTPRSPGQTNLEQAKPGQQMSLFGEAPSSANMEPIGKHGRILKSVPEGPKIPEKIQDPTLFKTREEAEKYLKSNDAHGKIYLVDVNHTTGEVKPSDIGIQKTNPKKNSTTNPATEGPARGMIRLYRGEGNNIGTGEGMRWYSTDPKKAAQYGDVSFVDVTRQELARFARDGKRSADEYISDSKDIYERLKPVSSSNPATEGLKATVRANADEAPDLSRMLEVMGDTTRASEIAVGSRAAAILADGDILGQTNRLARVVPDVFNPEKIVTGAAENLAAPRTARLIEQLRANSEHIAENVARLVKAGRAPEEAYLQAVQRESKRLEEQVIHGGATNDAVLNVGYIAPEKTLSNTAHVFVTLGKTDGSLFETVADAMHYAHQRYGLTVPKEDIKQVGQGFTIQVRKSIDETSDAFRESIKTANNSQKPSVWDTMLGFMRSADDRVPAMQRENRKAATNSHSALEKAFKDSIKGIGHMGKSSREEVFRVMKADKMEIDPAWKARFEGEEPPRGRFRETVEEFEVAFARANGGKVPTERQTKAYFTYRQLNDWDWVLRNVGVYRDRARQGMETVVIKDKVPHPTGNLTVDKSAEFVGRVIDELPFGSNHDASILVHNAGSDPVRYRLHSVRSNAEQMAEVKRLQSEGYRIIEVENPVRVPFEERFGRDTVNFIITKDVSTGPLDFIQIPYRPGWHTEYAQPFFVKQPKGRSVGGADGLPSRWVYEGDTSVFGFNTRAEAKKYAENMEKARIMLRDNRSVDLEAFLQKNLPWSRQDFELLFKDRPQSNGTVLPAHLDINAPFLSVDSGRYTTDVHGDLLRKTFNNFEDMVRSPHNKFANTDKKFLGQRDNPLWTVNERGSELKPLLEFADEIDPGLSLNRTMANIMRTRAIADYKISHVESWVAQFGHLLQDDIELIKNNPVHYIHNGSFVKPTVDNVAELTAAKNSRNAMIELLGTESDFQLKLDNLKMKLIDSIYGTAGWEVFNKAYRIASDYRPGKDPVSIMRHLATNLSIGLFNPYQMVQNAATMANAIAIAGPVHGFQGAAAILPMRYALKNETVLDSMAKKMTGFGWKPEWFKESYNEIKRTGKWIIEGEHTWKDDISGPSIVNGRWGQFLDAGLVFFKEGERATRLAAWNAAYLEFRKSNPTKVIDDTVRRALIDRSDLMAANMTRASNSAWQQGILAVPAQFLSYYARLAEQMLGKRLTTQEKLRVIGVNSILYGLPIGLLGSSGAGSVLGGMYPAHERIREEMLKRNINVDEGGLQLLNSGVIGLLGSVITGAPTDWHTKMGPGGASLLKNIMEDDSFLKIAFGASGSKVSAIFESFDPVTKYLMNPFRADDSQFTFRPEDALGMMRNIKSVDNAVGVWYAYNAGKAYAKNGQQLGDVTTRQMLGQMFLGASPQKVQDMYLKQDMLMDRQKVIKKIMDLASKDADYMIAAQVRGDVETAKLYQNRIAAHVYFGDLTVEEKTKLFSEFIKKHKDKIQTVDWNFIKNAPASQMQRRMEGNQ